MIYEPSYPNRNDVELPLLGVLVQLGGSICFSVRGRQIEDLLADRLRLTNEQREFASPNYHSEGNRKWRNEIQFVRNQLVKKGQLDNSRRDIWTITRLGYARLGIEAPVDAPAMNSQQKTTRQEILAGL